MGRAINPFPGGAVSIFIRDVWNFIHKRTNKTCDSSDEENVNPVGEINEEIALVETTVPEPISAIFRGYQQFSDVGIYVHGSWADGTNIAFSDVDDLIIYPDEEYVDKSEVKRLCRWLNSVDMRFCRLDPLQHHGHWILSRNQLAALDESYMPICVLHGALRLSGPDSMQVTIDVKKTHEGIARNILNTAEGIEQLFTEYQDGNINLYKMKCFIGSILLMPAYLFQYMGERVSKKWAIENAHQILHDDAIALITNCECIRKNWHTALQGWEYSLFKYIPYLFSNPHAYRIVAKLIAPKFRVELFPVLTRSHIDALLGQVKKITEVPPDSSIYPRDTCL